MLGKIIKDVRLERNLTQLQLAELLYNKKVASWTLQNISRIERKFNNYEMFTKIMEALDYSIELKMSKENETK